MATQTHKEFVKLTKVQSYIAQFQALQQELEPLITAARFGSKRDIKALYKQYNKLNSLAISSYEMMNSVRDYCEIIEDIVI